MTQASDEAVRCRNPEASGHAEGLDQGWQRVNVRWRGIPCGSGIIKGRSRTVVVGRLKKSGSRCSVDGANGIMAVRCFRMNSRGADFFQCGRCRVHESGRNP